MTPNIFVFVWRIVRNILLMGSGVLVFVAFMFFADSGIDPVRFAHNMVELSTYKMEAITHLGDNVSVTISEFCKSFSVDMQPECVVYQVRPFYNYTLHNDTIHGPDEYVMEGGVCRDVAVLYHSIFSRMGWYVQYDFSIPQHVFLVINRREDNDTIRCVVDALMYNCEKYVI